MLYDFDALFWGVYRWTLLFRHLHQLIAYLRANVRDDMRPRRPYVGQLDTSRRYPTGFT